MPEKKNDYVMGEKNFLVTIVFLLILIFALSNLTTAHASSENLVNENIRVHEGDLVIESGEKVVLKDEELLVRGNVFVKSDAQLRLENSLLLVSQEYKSQYKIDSKGSLEVINSKIGPSGGLSEKYESFFKTQLMLGGAIHSENSLIRARIGTPPKSKLNIENSKVAYIYWRPNAKLNLENSVVGDIVLDFKRDCTKPGKLVLKNLPTKRRVDYSFNTKEGGQLVFENSMIKQGWNINLQFGEKEVILKDTEVFLSWLKLPPTENEIELDLKGITGHVEYFVLENNVYGVDLPYNLILDNTIITNNFLKIEPFGSTARFENLTAMIHPRGDSNLVIEDSMWTAPNIYGMDRIKVADSKIVGPLKFLYLPQGGEVVNGVEMGSGGKGTLIFDSSTISVNFIKVACKEYSIKGGVEIDNPSSYEEVRWVKGKIIRHFPILVENNEKPVSNISLAVINDENEKVWTGKTNENGRNSFPITFNENNYREKYKVIVNDEEDKTVKKEVSFLTDTPIFFSPFPDFIVRNLRVSQEKVNLGENLEAAVDVRNEGQVKGTYTAELSIGRKTKKKKVYLSSGESETVTFEVSMKQPGSYNLKVGKHSKSIEVVEPVSPPEFEVSQLSIPSENVKVGEEITVSMRVKNTGGQTGSHTVKLSIGDESKYKNITLEPNQSKEVSFKVSIENMGDYELKAEEITKELEVVGPSEDDKEKTEDGELPLIRIGLALCIIIALVAGITIWKKT